MCVCLLLQDLVQSCFRGEGGILEDMCYDSEIISLVRRTLGTLRNLVIPNHQIKYERDPTRFELDGDDISIFCEHPRIFPLFQGSDDGLTVSNSRRNCGKGEG